MRAKRVNEEPTSVASSGCRNIGCSTGKTRIDCVGRVNLRPGGSSSTTGDGESAFRKEEGIGE